MKKYNKKIINDLFKKSKNNKNIKKVINQKEKKIYIKLNYIQILIIKFMLFYIFFSVILAKKIFRKLNFDNKITLKINTKGFIQVLGSNFNIIPSSVQVNNVIKTLNDKKLNLTSTSNTIIMSWSSIISNCSYMFNDLSYIEEIDLTSFNSSKIKNMLYMFNNCINLTKINFNGFSTSSVENMSFLFYNCLLLTSLDLSSFETSKVIQMKYMFYNCKQLKTLKLGRFTNSLTVDMKSIFQNCINLTSLDLSNFYIPKAEVIWDMFNGCNSLSSLNLSTFDTSQVTDMESMFEDCHSLVSINLNHFQTSNVYYMNKMFRYCYNLEYVYMKNITINPSLTMEDMFYGCSKLKYLNLYSIDKTASDISDMFSQTSANFTFCIENETNIPEIFNLLLGLPKTIRDCSNNCYHLNKIYFPENKICSFNCNDIYKYYYNYNCYISCPKKTTVNLDDSTCIDLNCSNYYNYNQNGCTNEIEEGYYLDDPEGKTIDKCHEYCRACNKKATQNNTNCLSCISDKYLYYGNCISNCKNNYFLDEKDNSTKICKCDNIKCKYCSEEALNLDLCDTCNEGYYPILNDSLNIGNYINCYKSPEGYYLDQNDSFYKKCYNTCKICNGFGDEKNNNCQECIDNHKFFEEFPDSNNCYEICPYYYYIDNEKNYICTEKLECPKDYNKLISEKSKCIDSCNKDGFYNYEFRKQCFNKCPSNTKISEEKNFYCKIECPKEYPFEMVEKQECVKNCNSNDRKLNLCITNYKDENEDDKTAQNQVQEDMQRDITKGNINLSSIENGTDYCFEDGQTSHCLSSTKNQKSNEKTNETTIDLGECEEKLKSYYNITPDDNLYIYLIKVNENEILAQKVEYEVYYPLNGTNLQALNLSICGDLKAEISVYANINDSEFDKYNSNSPFYTDICNTYKSEKGTDLSLEDRKKLYVENGYSLCEENCELTGYNKETKKASCSCQIKIKFPLISEIYIDKNKLYDSFSNIKTLANLKLMKCYKVLFTKQGILYNIGCYIMIPIIILHFITVIVFYLKDYKDILKIIKDLVYIKKNWKFLNMHNNIKKKGIKKKNWSKIYKNNKKKLSKKKKINNKKTINNKKSNRKSLFHRRRRNYYEQNRKRQKRDNSEKINLKKNIDLPNENNVKNNDEKKENDKAKNIEQPIFLKLLMKKESKQININIHNHNNNNNSPPIKKDKERRKKKSYTLNLVRTSGNFSNTSIKKLENNKQLNILKKHKYNKNETSNKNNQKLKIDLSIIKYNEYEMNTLPYNEAIKFDKRTYVQYYFSLLKIKHLIIVSFFPSKDYNSRIIKIYLFFFSFSIYFTVNALFINDDTMHQLYESGGSYDFIYQIPQILYSSFISSILHSILRTLSLSERNILEIKQEKAIENLDKKANEKKKTLFYKFMIFFIISIVFLLFFWYYVSCFCAIYSNTQIFLLKDSLISFSLSLLYPVGIYLIPGIFRIKALKAVKGDKESMYKFSKILQLI